MPWPVATYEGEVRTRGAVVKSRSNVTTVREENDKCEC